MEQIMLEKLTEISKILMVSHQKIENLQKVLIHVLKRDGKLPGLDNKDKFDNNYEN